MIILRLRVSQAAAKTVPKSPGIKSPVLSPRQAVYYAIVQHDFTAERADELDAKAGDHISIVAQSNYEWFVAKPISRLGRPGLIPVSFVAIHDPGTGRAMTEDEVGRLMERGDVPNVDEWKRSVLDYKAASISLGVIDDDSSRGPVPNSPFMPSHQMTPVIEQSPLETVQIDPASLNTPQPILSPGILLSAQVVSWHYEMNEYWFRIHALFQPDGPHPDNLPPAKHLLLFRVYNDFYDFQVAVLKAFPVEAGRDTPPGMSEPKRILPYMPGPSADVDDKITNMRKDELDEYLTLLCGLWEYGADHILRDELIRKFFTAKSGDAEEEVEPAYRILDERRAKRNSEQMQEKFSQMEMKDAQDRYSDASEYEEDRRSATGSAKGTNGGVIGRYDRNVTSPTKSRADAGHARAHSPYTSTSRTGSPVSQRVHSPTTTRNYSAEAALARSTSSYSQSRHEYGSSVTFTNSRRSDDDSPKSPISHPSQPPSAASAGSGAGRARSASNANSPPISASNPNTAFVKIKIFDRLTQDLIAIRVNPRVTHEQLMDKVRARLGDDVHQLAYRNSISNTFEGLVDDMSLKQWLESTDKHVLYAD